MPLSAIANEAGLVARTVGKKAALYGALALVALTGVGFLVAACFIALAAATSPLMASIIMGGSLLAIAGLTMAIMMQRSTRRERERRSRTANTALMASSVSLAATGLKIAGRIKNPMFWPAAAAVIAGLYLTRSGKD